MPPEGKNADGFAGGLGRAVVFLRKFVAVGVLGCPQKHVPGNPGVDTCRYGHKHIRDPDLRYTP